jgi:RND family efflux transporter MFP subunit
MQYPFTLRSAYAKALLAGLSLAGLSMAASAADDSTASLNNTFQGHTAPIERRAQNFDVPGVIDKILVKEGEAVKAGQLIAQQNTSVDEAQLKAAQLIANSTLEVEAEEAQLKADAIDFERKKQLFAQHSISPSEYDDAEVKVTIDALKVKHAKENREKATYDVAATEAKIHQKQMFARTDGVISEIATHEGELADTQHPAITVVKNDVVYVEVDLPADVVSRLKASGMKTPLKVRYVDEGEKGAWHDATVHFIKPEADPQSNFEHVQLEMPNPEMRSEGLQVTVKLPDNLMAPSQAASARVSASR